MKLKSLIRNLLSETDQIEIVKKSGIFLFFRIGALILGYIFTLVVIHYFGSAVYGMVALAFTVFVVLGIVGKLGFDVILTRLIASGEYNKEEISGFLGRSLGLSFLFTATLAIPIILFDDWIASQIFKKPQFAVYLFWTGVSFPFWSLIFIHNSVYRGLKKSRLFSFYTAFGRFLLVLIFLIFSILLFQNPSEEITMITHFMAIFVLFLSCYWVTYKKLGFYLWRPIKSSFREFFKASQTILYTSVVAILLVWIDRFFVGIYLDETAVGVYDVGARLALLISFNLDAINSILAPKIVELYRKEEKGPIQNLLQFSVNVSSILSIITFIILVLTHKWILNIFGSEYVDASTVLIILGLGQLLNCLCGSVGGILQMSGHQKTYQKIIFYGLIVNLLLNFMLVKRFGMEGVAVATFASVLCWNVLGAYHVKRLLGLQSYFNISRIFKKV